MPLAPIDLATSEVREAPRFAAHGLVSSRVMVGATSTQREPATLLVDVVAASPPRPEAAALRAQPALAAEEELAPEELGADTVP